MEDLLGALVVIITIAISISKKMKKSRKQTTGPIADIIKEAVEEEFDLPVSEPNQAAWPPAPEQTSFLAEEKPEPPKAVQAEGMPERIPVMGSLQTDTLEGEDPCHEEQFDEMDAGVALEPAPQEPAPLQLDWKGESMVKAFIMQEVLTRPCQRKRA